MSPRTPARGTRVAQRGVALIIALVVVALATMLATRIGSSGARDQRRSATLLAQQQAYQVALGAEAWAMEILRTDVEGGSRRDSLDEAWATPLPPLPIDGGVLSGGVEDMQGRFNLNNLVLPSGQRNEVAYAQFQRLLAKLQLEPKWASLLVDWLDPDTITTDAEGAEDGVYTGQQPPYRAANRYITSTSELLALPGFGPERYRVLQPFVAALPPLGSQYGSLLNVCTASGLVLDSLGDGLQFGADPKQLAANREKGCFPMKSDVDAALQSSGMPAAQFTAVSSTLAESSAWFRVTTRVSIGTTQLTLYSLLERNSGGYARTVLRTFGTE
jgi:general secretion pathway protein K